MCIGTYVYLTILPAEPLPNYGDVDNNGTVDAFDASLVLEFYATIATGGDISDYGEDFMRSADVDSNSSINAWDASLILSYYAYISTGGKSSIEDFINNRLYNS